MRTALSYCALALSSVPAAAQAVQSQLDVPGPNATANVLIVIADDLGVDMVGAYGESNDAPSTPNIDRLATGGMLFRNAWTAPMCSPSRASLQTGRRPGQTGIGFVLTDTATGLDPVEVTLPEMLKQHPKYDFQTALFGKWHLGGGNTGPLTQGYDTYKGYPNNLYQPHSFFSYTRYDNGTPVPCTTYATTDTVDQAIAWIATAQEPWFCVVSFHAPHEPFHAPPANLHTEDLTGSHPRNNPRPLYKAAVQAMDAEIGRMLLSMDAKLNHTNVFFMGDNGTPRATSVAPFLPEHAKLTPYEGGINIPLIVRGPAVKQPGVECRGLVTTTDIFATVADLSGIDLSTIPAPAGPRDSVSLRPYLERPRSNSRRQRAYASAFNSDPSGTGNSFAWHMLRDQRYKFIVIDDAGLQLEMYDLDQDPFEQNNLLAGALTPFERSAMNQAIIELRAILKDQ